MNITEYISTFRKAIDKFEHYGLLQYIDFMEEIRPFKQAALEVEAHFVDGSVLYIKEYIDAKYGIERLRYAYHFQDRESHLIFRYDNATHKPKLDFKNHLHTKNGTIVHAELPQIDDLVDLVIEQILL